MAAPSTVDATFAVGTLILLILILIWLHQSARPLIEAVTWQALDAVVATTGSAQSTTFADDADTMLATVLAQTQSGDTAGVLTRPAGADDPTLAAPGDDATRPAPPGPTLGWSDATIAAAPSEQTIADDTAATRLAPTPRKAATTSEDDETASTLTEEEGTRPSIAHSDETIPDDTSTTQPNIGDR